MKGGTRRLKSECCEANAKRVTRNAVKVKLQKIWREGRRVEAVREGKIELEIKIRYSRNL